MDDNLPTLEDFAWAVLRMRDAQKSHQRTGSPFAAGIRQKCEAQVDELCSRIVLPPLPFEAKGGDQ